MFQWNSVNFVIFVLVGVIQCSDVHNPWSTKSEWISPSSQTGRARSYVPIWLIMCEGLLHSLVKLVNSPFVYLCRIREVCYWAVPWIDFWAAVPSICWPVRNLCDIGESSWYVSRVDLWVTAPFISWPFQNSSLCDIVEPCWPVRSVDLWLTFSFIRWPDSISSLCAIGEVCWAVPRFHIWVTVLCTRWPVRNSSLCSILVKPVGLSQG